MSISIQEYFINKPAKGVDFAETPINLPLGFSVVKLDPHSADSTNLIKVWLLVASEETLHPERFIVVRSKVDLVPILGRDPWFHNDTIFVVEDVEKQDVEGNISTVSERVAYHVFVFLSTAERMAMQRQAVMMAQGGVDRGGPSGSGLILPGR